MNIENKNLDLSLSCELPDTANLRKLLGNDKNLPFSFVGLRASTPPLLQGISVRFKDYKDYTVDRSYFELVKDNKLINVKPIYFPENKTQETFFVSYVIISSLSENLQIRCFFSSPLSVYPGAVVRISSKAISINLIK